MDITNMRAALVELLYRNPQRHDRHAYEFDLAMWGLGLMEDKPDPEDFGQPEIDLKKAEGFAEKMAAVDYYE